MSGGSQVDGIVAVVAGGRRSGIGRIGRGVCAGLRMDAVPYEGTAVTTGARDGLSRWSGTETYEDVTGASGKHDLWHAHHIVQEMEGDEKAVPLVEGGV